MPAVEPHWTAYVTAIATPIVAVMAAIIAGTLSYRSWRTAQNKLKLDLFDKRMSLFDELQSFFLLVYSEKWSCDEEDSFEEFLKFRTEANWIFSDSINKWLKEELTQQFQEFALAFKELEDEYEADKKKEIRKRIVAIKGQLIASEKYSRELFGEDMKLRT